MSIINLL